MLVQNNELVEILQERVRELEAEADTNRQQLDDAEQQLKDAQDANQYVAAHYPMHIHQGVSQHMTVLPLLLISNQLAGSLPFDC